MKRIQFIVNRALFAIIFAGLVQSGFAQQAVTDSDSLLFMSMEDLMNLEIEVTSVSKKAESIKMVPSSIYVISANDIERSSATNLMELLREVPGYWAVSSDYLNVDAYMRNSSENSVLVLLDGTPVQDIMSSDFNYGNFDIPLTQISRIEVIKGSGGTVYGANSASGVINIFTKNPGKQSKVFAEVKGGASSFADVNVSFSSKVNEKFALSGYGKYGHFGGFEQTPESTNATSAVLGPDGTTPTTITNRYTEDDNTVSSMVAGLRLKFNPSDKFDLSAGVHFNTIKRNSYVSYVTPENSYLIPSADGITPRPEIDDDVYYANNDANRITLFGKADYSFSDNHSVFARVSSNIDNTHYVINGGYEASNSIMDLEIQDNFTLAFNQVSVGMNYRKLNYDIHDIYNTDNINYIDPQNSATLTGFFAQDKLSFLDDKLLVYLGVKGENFSLLNNKYYFSPMAKVVVQPIEMLTLWGGYTKAYTTPGYNQTNIELFVYRAKTPDVFYNYTKPFVTQGVYDLVYDQAIGGGADDETAKTMAEAYVTSEEGQTVIHYETTNQIEPYIEEFPGHYNSSVINSTKTEPTSFETLEIGLRLHPGKKLYFETSFYISNIKNGVGNSPNSAGIHASPTNQGEYTEAYFYGNYLTGTNIGVETLVKYTPLTNLMIELSHSYYKGELYYQENEDFPDVDTEKNITDEDYPIVPRNVFRWKRC